MKPVKNPFIGQKVGRLTLKSVEEIVYRYSLTKNIGYFVCDCGNEISFPLAKFGNKTSCGCKEKERRHNKCRTSVYNIWTNIKTRCNCKTYKQYPDYGGRGIRMCEGFKNFLYFESFMGQKPSSKHSVDRINNDGWYCCGECEDCKASNRAKNVRWATPKEQSYNKRNNLYLMYKGERMCLAQIVEKSGIPQNVLHQRIVKLKWTVEEATNIPIGGRNSRTQDNKIIKNQYSK